MSFIKIFELWFYYQQDLPQAVLLVLFLLTADFWALVFSAKFSTSPSGKTIDGSQKRFYT